MTEKNEMPGKLNLVAERNEISGKLNWECTRNSRDMDTTNNFFSATIFCKYSKMWHKHNRSMHLIIDLIRYQILE